LPPPPPGPPPPGAERHERREEREDVEYENQMREALRRSVEDQGRPRGHYGSSRDSHYRRHAHDPQDGGESSQYNHDPRDEFRNVGGGYPSTRYPDHRSSEHGRSQYYPPPRGSYANTGYTDYSSSQYGGSQYYPGMASQDLYGSHESSYYSGSNQGATTGSQENDPIPPPTFTLPQYGNYGQGGQSSGYGPHGGSS
jgi:hypothetical protein